MTTKQFWVDPYQTKHSTLVTKIDGCDIELDDTIFYAESGGQESDFGTIGGIEVAKATKHGSRIVYTLTKTPDFIVGDEVETNIDWDRRYALMKLHFAAEVVLEIFTQTLPNIEKIGAHISSDKSRIDFVWHESIGPLLPEFAESANRIIEADSTIVSAFSDEDAERRYWQVEGFAKVSCGGTHLRRTSEVGRIKLRRKNIGKGKERVEITLVNES